MGNQYVDIIAGALLFKIRRCGNAALYYFNISIRAFAWNWNCNVFDDTVIRFGEILHVDKPQYLIGLCDRRGQTLVALMRPLHYAWTGITVRRYLSIFIFRKPRLKHRHSSVNGGYIDDAIKTIKAEISSQLFSFGIFDTLRHHFLVAFDRSTILTI